jgi:hypothetical protein
MKQNKTKTKTKYTIGKLAFSTKKDCLKYTRSIINQLGCCKITKSHAQYEFFSNLLHNHLNSKEKIGVGIDYFFIQPNSFIKKYYETMIKRMDGSEIDFSWNKCCQFKKNNNSMEELIKAMRYATKLDILKFRNKHEAHLICSYCHCTDKEKEYHVDHENPSFHVLKNNFLQSTTKTLPTRFDEDPSNHATIFQKSDEPFEMEWRQFHQQHCNLQILCKKCNLTKKKE